MLHCVSCASKRDTFIRKHSRFLSLLSSLFNIWNKFCHSLYFSILKLLSLVNINHIVIIKKHNQQKVDCKLWTDKHIKTSTKNLQFSDQNSSWKIVNLQFSHDREITRLYLYSVPYHSVQIFYYILNSWSLMVNS